MPLPLAEPSSALVVRVSRRFVWALTGDGVIHETRSRSRALDVVVGDRVRIDLSDRDPVVVELLPRRSCLSRRYRDETRQIVSNLDRLLIITAVGPLFNYYFVDRIMCVAAEQQIPFTLVMNKGYLGVVELEEFLALYRSIGISVLCTSATTGSELDSVRDILQQSELQVVALCGVSGVGKSSIINQLIPDAGASTGELSERSGQGRQTTSQPRGYLYPRPPHSPLVLVDLPGIQSFGVGHLSGEQIVQTMPDIARHAAQCEFDNCSHIEEDQCAVKEAVEEGEIAITRYESYIRMLAEVEEARPY